MKKIIVFGASDDGLKLIRDFFPLRNSGLVQITAIIDNDSRLDGSSIEGIPVMLPRKAVKSIEFDEILVTPIFFEAISTQLQELGVDRNKISSIFHDPKLYFDSKKREFDNNSVGKYSYFKPGTKLYNTEVGSFCHIGGNSVIGLGGHRTDLPTTYPLRYHFSDEINDPSKDNTSSEIVNDFKKTEIRDDVYIGEGVTIKEGVVIGEGSIIASKAFVTKDVPPYSIIGGIPAKIIKKRFDDDQIEKLLQISWWKFPKEKLAKSIPYLESDDINKAISSLINLA